MKPFSISIVFIIIALLVQADLLASDDALTAAVADSRRNVTFAQRDVARHPQAVLEFFGIRPNMSVAEIWPSSGWWSEILAPYLKEEGKYYAAGYSLSARRTPKWRKNMATKLNNTFSNDPQRFDKVIVSSLSIPEDTEIAPPGSLDMVLTFRNVHNWIKGDYAAGVFAAMFTALKPGGVLGLVEHRARHDADIELMKLSGYVSEAYVISAAQDAGFKLLEKSEINANPSDTKDHPTGVWSLPPSLRYCRNMTDEAEAVRCSQHYRSIGESDRMTLRFLKPDSTN